MFDSSQKCPPRSVGSHPTIVQTVPIILVLIRNSDSPKYLCFKWNWAFLKLLPKNKISILDYLYFYLVFKFSRNIFWSSTFLAVYLQKLSFKETLDSEVINRTKKTQQNKNIHTHYYLKVNFITTMYDLILLREISAPLSKCNPLEDYLVVIMFRPNQSHWALHENITATWGLFSLKLSKSTVTKNISLQTCLAYVNNLRWWLL